MKLVWFRNDLRVVDNPALFRACEDASLSTPSSGVLAVVVLTPEQWFSHDDSPSKVEFWLANLTELRVKLQQLNIPLKVIQGDVFDNTPASLLRLSHEYNCDALYFNHEYALNEQRRDTSVTKLFGDNGIKTFSFHGDVIVPPSEISNQKGLPYRVFTPFSKSWRRSYLSANPQPLTAPNIQILTNISSDQVPRNIEFPNKEKIYWREDLWPAGEHIAHEKLHRFTVQRVNQYSRDRDYPALEGTSSLSPYLTTGVLSARQCIAGLRANDESHDWLESQWLTEIIWREFYRHLMVQFPKLNKCEAFRPEVENRIVWSDDPVLFAAWCNGETGFSIVDAGMKQLRETGWMHNRVRMICASFLTKLLRQDWRRGAQFFMQHLVDGDFSSNLGGWQWCASVGADSAPYFRIFNPLRQAERFDPLGDYVARWLPELTSLPEHQRHNAQIAMTVGRPMPVIDYAKARAESLSGYQNR